MSTMREVAARAGVSGKTVSRVINGDRYVSADVRARVEQAILDLQYVPNMLSQTFRAGRDSAIGVAVPDIADGFFGAVIQAVESVARERRTAVLVTSLGADRNTERAAVEALLNRQIAGLIIAPIAADQSYMVPWQQRTEMVFIDRPPHRIRADSVVEDNFGAATTAVRHLIEGGHRRIGFVGNAAAAATIGRRLDGYRAALAEANVVADPRLEILYQGAAATSVPAVLELLAAVDPPTALFSANSETSVAIVPVLHEHGRTDVAFVSFGDFPMAAALRPSVTVLDQNPAALGRTAAGRLFDRIDGTEKRLKRHLVLPVELRVRQSTPSVSIPSHATEPSHTNERDKK